MSFEPLTPERRRAMTRRHLLDAAAIVFARDGFHGATLDEVAKTAGFTKGAVYSNFKSKDDLFLAVCQDHAERQFAVIEEVLDSVPHQTEHQMPRVRELMTSQILLWDDTWQALYLEFILYARRNPEARAKVAERDRYEQAAAQHFIEQEYAARGQAPSYPARDLAQITRAIFLGLQIERLEDPDAVTEQTIDTTLRVLDDLMELTAKPLPPRKRPSKKARASGE
jgi:AcrR family transcriptional regulator